MNEATQGMQQPDHIKLYISQYLIRLSNLMNRISTYKGMYEISWDRKQKELKENSDCKDEDKLFTIELHQISAINLCENDRFMRLMINYLKESKLRSLFQGN